MKDKTLEHTALSQMSTIQSRHPHVEYVGTGCATKIQAPWWHATKYGIEFSYKLNV